MILTVPTLTFLSPCLTQILSVYSYTDWHETASIFGNLVYLAAKTSTFIYFTVRVVYSRMLHRQKFLCTRRVGMGRFHISMPISEQHGNSTENENRLNFSALTLQEAYIPCRCRHPNPIFHRNRQFSPLAIQVAYTPCRCRHPQTSCRNIHVY